MFSAAFPKPGRGKRASVKRTIRSPDFNVVDPMQRVRIISAEKRSTWFR